jgi:hypothetical protein
MVEMLRIATALELAISWRGSLTMENASYIDSPSIKPRKWKAELLVFQVSLSES